MRFKKENWVSVTLGKKGSGKSFLVKQIILEFDRVFVIDSIGEYDEQCKVVWGFKDCIDAIVEASKSKKFRIALRTDSIEEDLALIKLIQTIPKILIVIEETSKYQSASSMPVEIEHLIRYGRHKAISQIYIARRARELNRDLTANADTIITFRQHEPRDIAYLREFMEDRAETLKDLGQYRFAVWGDKEKLPLAVVKRM